MFKGLLFLSCVLLVVADTSAVAPSDQPVTSVPAPNPDVPTTQPVTTPAPSPTLPSPDQTDLCSSFMQSQCTDALASDNLLTIMKCASTLFIGLTAKRTTSALEPACLAQMKGSLLVCTEDFDEVCDETDSFKHLKKCAHENMDDFSPACQVSLETFKEKLDIAQKRLWKHSNKHHGHSRGHHNRQIADYQWLWGGEIVSNPDHSKWAQIWHTWGKYVVGALALVLLILMCRCCRKRRCARRAAASQNRTTHHWMRWRRCCSRSFWDSSSVPLNDETASAPVSFVQLPTGQVSSQPTPVAQPVNPHCVVSTSINSIPEGSVYPTVYETV